MCRQRRQGRLEGQFHFVFTRLRRPIAGGAAHVPPAAAGAPSAAVSARFHKAAARDCGEAAHVPLPAAGAPVTAFSQHRYTADSRRVDWVMRVAVREAQASRKKRRLRGEEEEEE